jgi:inorganic triphosphatase YgiF
MQEEIELKLAFPSAQVKKLRRMPLLKSLKAGRTVRSQLVSTYFDTPEFALRQAGMALRVRDRGGRKLQTLKAPVPGAEKSGLQHFAEYEAEVDESRPEFDKLEDPRLRRWISKMGPPQKFGPIFTTRVMRTTMPLRLADSDIELAIDEGSIEAQDRKVPLREIELELKSGCPTRLYELALMLVKEDIDFGLERRTKAARGYALYESADDSPVKAAPLDLPAGSSVGGAFGLIAQNCCDQIRANEAAVMLGEDPEGVHQMRVAVRRLRALLSLFKSVLAGDVRDHLKVELRWLQQQLGPPRDWDVFLADTLAPIEARFPDEEAVETMRRTAGELREAAYERASADVASGRYAGILLHLQMHLADGRWFRGAGREGVKFIDRPVKGFASNLMDKHADRLTKLGNKHKTLTESQLHQLRIEGKKMRYAVDFFRSLYPESVSKAYRASLVDIQDNLGAVNDIVVARRLLAQLDKKMRKGERKAPKKISKVLGLLKDEQAARLADNLRGLDTVWREHAKLKPFWR